MQRTVEVAAVEAIDQHSANSAEGLAGAVHGMRSDAARHRQVFRRWDVLRYGPRAILRHLWVQLAVLGTMFASCAWVFHYFQGLDAVSAILASVSTITTIGIYAPAGGITHLMPAEQVSLIVLFLVSVGAAASLVQGVISQMVDRTLWTEEVLRREVDKMSGHTIVMGYSYLGRYVAEQLDELKQPYVVIIRHAEHVPGLRRDGVPAFSAPVTEFHRILEIVGVRRAGAMICTFEEDPDNLIAILYANKVRPALRIITTVHDRELIGSAEMAGADVVVPTANILGGLLAVATVSKEVAGVLLSSKIPGRYLAEFTVPSDRKFTFAQLNQIAPILLVFENGQVRTNPPDDYVIAGGSTILVLSSHETIARLRAHLGGPVSTPIE